MLLEPALLRERGLDVVGRRHRVCRERAEIAFAKLRQHLPQREEVRDSRSREMEKLLVLPELLEALRRDLSRDRDRAVAHQDRAPRQPEDTAEKAREGWALRHVMRQDPERAPAHRDDRVRALGGPLLLEWSDASIHGSEPISQSRQLDGLPEPVGDGGLVYTHRLGVDPRATLLELGVHARSE
ncbi:MAG: hypothetical protein ACREXS_05405 [Gammaproteobacteria bacterium]